MSEFSLSIVLVVVSFSNTLLAALRAFRFLFLLRAIALFVLNSSISELLSDADVPSPGTTPSAKTTLFFRYVAEVLEFFSEKNSLLFIGQDTKYWIGNGRKMD